MPRLASVVRRQLLVLSVLAAACAPAPTQLVVVVDTDLAIPTELDGVVVEITGPLGATESERATLGDRATLPLTLGVAPTGEQLGPIDVVAIGSRGGGEVVRRHHRVTLLRGESRMLVLHLSRACSVRTEPCARDMTCGENGCVAIEIPASELPPWSGAASGYPDGGMRCERDLECEDDEECTRDVCVRGECAHEPLSIACDDEIFCNGLDTCRDGSCAAHGGDPCTAPTTCVESALRCMGCTDAMDCPAGSTTDWGACAYVDGCALAGTETRSTRTWACVAEACVPTDVPESRACGMRATDGVSCAATTCTPYDTCSYGGTCSETAHHSRSCTVSTCSAGTCTPRTTGETAACETRDTDGTICGGAPGCGPWGGCGGFAGTCGQDGTQTRSCRGEPRCGGGSCNDAAPSDDTRGCSRSTDGVSCGPATCGPWGACEGFAEPCGRSGSQTRTCQPQVCGGGGCGLGGAFVESMPCSRETDGFTCEDGDGCTTNDFCSSEICYGGYYWC